MLRYLSFLVFIVLTTSAVIKADEELRYELLNREGLKECVCNATLELTPVCADEEVDYNKKEMATCIDKCSEKSAVQVIHDKECPKKSNAKSLESYGKGMKSWMDNPFIQCDCVATTLNPVCGNDGKTYPHASYLYCIRDCKRKNKRYKNLQMAYCGPCQKGISPRQHSHQRVQLSTEVLEIFKLCNCNFTWEYNPVYATDQVTYDNPSIFYCTKKCIDSDIHVEHCGKYEDSDRTVTNNCQCLATREYYPICASDGYNYVNGKVFDCAKKCMDKNIKVQYHGICDDGKIVPNPSLREIVGRTDESSAPKVKRNIIAEPEPLDYYFYAGCNCLISVDYLPVCGTDGVTYSNPMELTCLNTCKSRSVLIAHHGPCILKPLTERPVIPSFGCRACRPSLDSDLPLCASDGKTYANPSSMKCANVCEKKNVTKAHDGRCVWEKDDVLFGPSECYCDIVFENAPVCGSDRRSYISRSYLNCVNKCERKDTTILHRGFCKGDKNQYPEYDLPVPIAGKKCTCTITYESNPVCANDGETYSNPSYVICVNKCKNQSVDIVNNGPCKKEKKTLLSLYSLLESKSHVFSKLTADQLRCVKTFCPKTHDVEPVCGSDGITYENRLQVTCAKNCYRPDLVIVSSLACEPTITNDFRECSCQKPPTIVPICGSDGRLYPHFTTLVCIKACKNRDLVEKKLSFCKSRFIN